ncbi:MAG: glycine cleavage system aminomethyltransferase GcvT [Myxococcota bacterium]
MADTVETPLHAVHRLLGARLVPFAGFEMPVQYEGILAEHRRVRKHVGLFDVSHMGEVRVAGPDAVDVVNRLVTNDLGRLEDGRAMYTCMCAEDGTIVDDLIVYRLSADEVFLCVNAANRESDFAHMRQHADGEAELIQESDAWAQIAVQGPDAPTLLGRVFDEEIRDLGFFRIRTRDFGGEHVYVSTTGYTGEKGAEIYCPPGVAVDLWAALTDEGRDLHVGPTGLGARDTLRLEAALCLYGNDIDRSTTPLEANLGWVVKLDKGDFVGREALLRQKEEGVRRSLVGIEMVEKGIPRHGYAIVHEGEEVGHVTSGTRSPSTGRSIGLAYVPTTLTDPGTIVSVDCRGRERAARVVETPFYRRPKKG